MYFDLDLNFIKETKLINQYLGLGKTDSGYIGVLYNLDHMFSLLDKNFNIVESIIKPNRTLAFKNIPQYMIYRGELVDGGMGSVRSCVQI